MDPFLNGKIDPISMRLGIWYLISVSVRDPKSPGWTPMCYLTQLRSLSWITVHENTQIISKCLRLPKISFLLSLSAVSSPQQRLTHPQPPLGRASVFVSLLSQCGGGRRSRFLCSKRLQIPALFRADPLRLCAACTFWSAMDWNSSYVFASCPLPSPTSSTAQPE